MDNHDHIIDVNQGRSSNNYFSEYDQVNILCPQYDKSTTPNIEDTERFVIYHVNREEYEMCRVMTAHPKVVGVCSRPYTKSFYTISFRSFSPSPGGLEFQPGQDYYFISTSSPEDLHRRVGGGCSTHNMKMIFKVSDNRDQHAQINAPRGNNFGDSNELMDSVSSFSYSTTTTTTPKPVVRFNSKVLNHRGSIYYYHPRDLIGVDNNSLDNRQRRPHPNDSWQKEALRDPNSSSSFSASICVLVLSFMALLCV